MSKIDMNGVSVTLTDIIMRAVKKAANDDGISVEHELEMLVKFGLMAKTMDQAKVRYQYNREGRRIQ